MKNTKTILGIVGGVAVVALLGWGLFYLIDDDGATYTLMNEHGNEITVVKGAKSLISFVCKLDWFYKNLCGYRSRSS